jgi:sarcosine/dimethylglycine N-methyltransferase
MKQASSEVVRKAEEYYDSSDADSFYNTVWGGEDIHVGIYHSTSESIYDASRRTVEQMAEKLNTWPSGTQVLDIGAGYGGSGRYLAREKHYEVSCLNLSEVQNERNRRLTEEANLSGAVQVVYGNFESLPFGEKSFDVVWAQDAILHSGNRKKVFEEVHRVLRPGGEFIFTDPMQKHGADAETLKPVLERIHLESMGSVECYVNYARELGLETIEVLQMPEQLVNHYSAVLRNLESRHDELKDACEPAYLERMQNGLKHWIDAGKNNALDWGILHFRKAYS